MKLPSITFAIPWLLVLTGLSEIYFGAFTKLVGANLEPSVRLFDIAGIIVALGGLLGVLLAIIGWVGGNKVMMIHGLIAVGLGALFAVKVFSGPANTNLHSMHQPPESSDSE